MPDGHSLQQLVTRLRHPAHRVTLDRGICELLEDAAAVVEQFMEALERLEQIERMLDSLEITVLMASEKPDTMH